MLMLMYYEHISNKLLELLLLKLISAIKRRQLFEAIHSSPPILVLQILFHPFFLIISSSCVLFIIIILYQMIVINGHGHMPQGMQCILRRQDHLFHLYYTLNIRTPLPLLLSHNNH